MQNIQVVLWATVVLCTSLKMNSAAPHILLPAQRIDRALYLPLQSRGQMASQLLPVNSGVYYLMRGSLPSSGNIRLPSLADVIQIIPFLPIEVNVPDTVMGVYGFFSWLVNRGSQDNGTPRIYLVYKNMTQAQPVNIQTPHQHTFHPHTAH